MVNADTANAETAASLDEQEEGKEEEEEARRVTFFGRSPFLSRWPPRQMMKARQDRVVLEVYEGREGIALGPRGRGEERREADSSSRDGSNSWLLPPPRVEKEERGFVLGEEGGMREKEERGEFYSAPEGRRGKSCVSSFDPVAVFWRDPLIGPRERRMRRKAKSKKRIGDIPIEKLFFPLARFF